MPGGVWTPSAVLRSVEAFPTGASVVKVVTDVGDGFLKVLGNAGGPYVLAAELIGTKCAEWLGLPTLDFALVQLEWDGMVGLASGTSVAGPAFITREVRHEEYSGQPDQLQRLTNPGDLTRLVVLDTWLRNCDRYSIRDSGYERANRDNVFLQELGADDASLQLVAMDFSHCLTCGRTFSNRVLGIDAAKEDVLYGLFPEWRTFYDPAAAQQALTRLQSFSNHDAQTIVHSVPTEWLEEREDLRGELVRFLVQRAGYVAQHAATWF